MQQPPQPLHMDHKLVLQRKLASPWSSPEFAALLQTRPGLLSDTLCIFRGLDQPVRVRINSLHARSSEWPMTRAAARPMCNLTYLTQPLTPTHPCFFNQTAARPAGLPGLRRHLGAAQGERAGGFGRGGRRPGRCE